MLFTAGGLRLLSTMVAAIWEWRRQWSKLATERTNPVLLALKSMVCLLAKNRYKKQGQIKINGTVWYCKQHVTFSDVLAAVRRQL